LADTERPRVGHIITRLILGGAQENTLYTVIGQQRDYDVTLIIGVDDGTEGSLRDRAAAANVRVLVVPTLVRPIRPLTDLRALASLVRLLRRERFDVVHTHSSKAGILGRLAARIAGVPVVVHTLHSLVFHEYQAAWKNSVYIWLKRRCAPITDLLISVNDRTTRGALAAGIGRPEQYLTIYSGFELDRFLTIRDRLTVEAAKQRLGIPPAAPVVGKIARLFPLKGHEQFLPAAAEIARMNPAVWFLLVGDGPIRPEIEQQFAALGLRDRTVFTGRVPPDEVPACIQAMDVVVHTSLREGLARVLPQAGAVGKPIVTFDLDGAPEVVKEGVSGYLVKPLDTSTLARRVIELLADPERSHRMGESGRAFVEKTFSVERMVQLINEQYERLLAARACPRIADVPR
jgi:glycosyltransferase involved in cell wall biosynthesis